MGELPFWKWLRKKGWCGSCLFLRLMWIKSFGILLHLEKADDIMGKYEISCKNRHKVKAISLESSTQTHVRNFMFLCESVIAQLDGAMGMHVGMCVHACVSVACVCTRVWVWRVCTRVWVWCVHTCVWHVCTRVWVVCVCECTRATGAEIYEAEITTNAPENITFTQRYYNLLKWVHMYSMKYLSFLLLKMCYFVRT